MDFILVSFVFSLGATGAAGTPPAKPQARHVLAEERPCERGVSIAAPPPGDMRVCVSTKENTAVHLAR